MSFRLYSLDSCKIRLLMTSALCFGLVSLAVLSSAVHASHGGSGASHHHSGGDGYYGGGFYGGSISPFGLYGSALGGGYPYINSRYGYSSLSNYQSNYRMYNSVPAYQTTPVYSSYIQSVAASSGVMVIQPASNVYTGGMSSTGEPTGELRPGMRLPDGSIVVSVGK